MSFRSSSKRTSASDAATSKKKKKKSNGNIRQSLLNGFSNHASLSTLHKGKRLLLAAKFLYKKIPPGEENYLYLYQVDEINDDCKTATIDYEGRYVEEGTCEWKNYPILDDEDRSIDNYRIDCIKTDHDLYNKYLGQANKVVNDQKELNKKKEDERKKSSETDVSDIDRRIKENNQKAYDVLLLEFEAAEEEQEHIIARGVHTGDITAKQQWKHKRSGHEFVWHKPHGKTKFESAKLWKVSRVIIEKKLPGYLRLRRILTLGNMLGDTDEEGGTIVKYSREEDMKNRVQAVLAVLSSKVPLSVLGNDHFRQYTYSLNPKHRPPNHLEINRIIEVTMDLAVLEMNRIVKELRDRLIDQFLSISTDFWTDKYRRESYGVLVLSVVAEKYVFNNGRELFMSRETAKRNEAMLLSSNPSLDVLHYAANFERFRKKKNIDNVFSWMMESLEELKLHHSDLNQVTADGAGNAIGSVAEFESKTRSFRGNDVEVEVCVAHQNERSGGYASGTIEFAEPVNAELGEILAKSHRLQTFINRSPERLIVYTDVAERNGRDPILRPKPGIDIRWNSSIDEARRANIIMGDVCETLQELLSEGGLDHNLLSAQEKESGDIEKHTYTEEDKMIIRQYEAAADRAKLFSKFLQTKGNNRFSYLLFEVQYVLHHHKRDYLCMSQDISHTKGVEDLRRRRNNRAIAFESGADVNEEELPDWCEESYEMNSVIETYRAMYSKDLSERLGINRNVLPPAYSIATLLNPMFGLQPLIVGSGLMTQDQYRTSRKALVKRIQDILDATHPTPTVLDDSSVDSLDGDLPIAENENYKKAESELNAYEQYKRRKYHPTITTKGGRYLSGFEPVEEDKAIKLWHGPVDERGSDLPSGKNLADYIDKHGRMDLLRFTSDHKSLFPSIAIIVQCEASRQTEEVGCERFFGLSGYVSSPRRSRLGVRNYERIALLSDILRNVYIDPQEIASQYLLRCKAGRWKKENTIDSLKCFNLERVIDADSFHIERPQDVSIQEYLAECSDENSGDNSSDSS